MSSSGYWPDGQASRACTSNGIALIRSPLFMASAARMRACIFAYVDVEDAAQDYNETTGSFNIWRTSNQAVQVSYGFVTEPGIEVSDGLM